MKNKEIAKLVRKVQKGDQKAFEEIYDATIRIVYFYLHKMVDHNESIDDMAQEVYYNIFQQLKNLRHPEAFNQWMYRIITGVVDKHYRKEQPYTVDLEMVSEVLVDDSIESMPVELLERKDLQKEVLDLIDKLPPKEKEAVLLYYYRELSLKEVSGIMNTSENAVLNRLYAARKKLKQRFAKKDGVGKIPEIEMAAIAPLISITLREEGEALVTPSIKNEIWNNLSAELGINAATAARAAVSTGSGITSNIAIAAVTLSLVGAGTWLGINIHKDMSDTEPASIVQTQQVVSNEDIIAAFSLVNSYEEYKSFQAEYRFQDVSYAAEDSTVQYYTAVLPRGGGEEIYVGIKTDGTVFEKVYEICDGELSLHQPVQILEWFENARKLE